LYERYSRQILFAEIGEVGQQRLLESSAVLVGCGALGTALANLLARAGVGRLRIIDRDFVEPSNLQRQTLFEESDAAQSLPKAVAAEKRLRAINSGIAIEGVVADLSPKNAVELLQGFPLILDGTDNFETRFLLNDAAIHLGVPWIYAAVVASYGVTMTIRPGESACLACALESSSASGARATPSPAEDTCDTVGVLGAAITAQAVATRVPFAVGAVFASWTWFLVLATAAHALRRFMTKERRVWFDRVSGLILLVFAGWLAVEFVQTLV
jgi:molybdopterin-synthase adenylyltransferase